jgi:hypothetical protein
MLWAEVYARAFRASQNAKKGGVHEGNTPNFRKGPFFLKNVSLSCCSDIFSPVHWFLAFAPARKGRIEGPVSY